MKKEVVLVISASLFILAYVIDYFAGPVGIKVKNQLAFLTPATLAVYPFTTVAIFARILALLLSTLLLFSFIEKKYFTKAAVLLFLGALAQLYAIQQLATGMRTTSIQWTLSIAYTGFTFIIPVIIYFVMGIIFLSKEEEPPAKSSILDSLSKD